MLETPARLPFAWWNTKVAPPSCETRATPEHRSAVGEVVRALIGRHGCRIVALAEVRREDVLRWIPDEMRAMWDAARDTSGERHDFDLAIAFDREHLALMDLVQARGHYAGQAVRAGLVATFGLVDGSGWLIVVAAHWRSDRGGVTDAQARRACAAEALRNAIVARLKHVGHATPVLILGDFNAEPFEDPFRAGLPTARSRVEVQRHRARTASDVLFYNASWRWLGERYPWDREQQPPTLAGTYRLDGGRTPHSWRTFDQVLVSASLLESDGWSLDEGVLNVLDDARVFDRAAARPRAPFDHLPIVGHLQRPALSIIGRERQS